MKEGPEMQEQKQLETMTEKQEAYLSALLETRICPASVSAELDFLNSLSLKPDKLTASKYITALHTAPYKPKTYGAQSPAPAPAIHTTVSVSPAFAAGAFAPAVDTVSQYGATVTVHGAAASKSKWQQWQDMPLGYYTVTGSHYSYGDTGVAVYLVSTKKRKYGGDEKICRRLWCSY